jgi:hypothetical protein
VVLDAPQELLDERRRRGRDVRNEVLGITLRAVDGELEATWGEGFAGVRPGRGTRLGPGIGWSA